MIENNTQIFCDMDGVLVDFKSTAISLINSLLDGGQLPGVSRTKSHFYRVKQVHDELGKDWRAETGSDLQIPFVKRLMFISISSNPGVIFSSMQPHQDGITQLWDFLNKSGLVVNILSAPINGNKNAPTSAEDGKTSWVENWLTPQPKNIIITPSARKYEHATTNGVANILVDDKSSTIDAWNAAGGIGILHVPKNSEKTIQQLADMLN